MSLHQWRCSNLELLLDNTNFLQPLKRWMIPHLIQCRKSITFILFLFYRSWDFRFLFTFLHSLNWLIWDFLPLSWAFNEYAQFAFTNLLHLHKLHLSRPSSSWAPLTLETSIFSYSLHITPIGAQSNLVFEF